MHQIQKYRQNGQPTTTESETRGNEEMQTENVQRQQQGNTWSMQQQIYNRALGTWVNAATEKSNTEIPQTSPNHCPQNAYIDAASRKWPPRLPQKTTRFGD